MPWTSQHIKWLQPASQSLKTADGKTIEVREFQHKSDAVVLSAWAKHFRHHYCLDIEIDTSRQGTGLSRSEYLTQLVFPDSTSKLGPPIRAGDFAEILVADYVQYVLNYWVPRTRYCAKTVRDESTKGCDIIGLKLFGNGTPTSRDELMLFEAKAQFSGDSAKPRLQDAVDDSVKDQLRLAESLNAMKRQLLRINNKEDAKKIERFQSRVDHPCKEVYGAAALFTSEVLDPAEIGKTTTAHHPAADLQLVVIHGVAMMDLVHGLYRRAANEA